MSDQEAQSFDLFKFNLRDHIISYLCVCVCTLRSKSLEWSHLKTRATALVERQKTEMGPSLTHTHTSKQTNWYSGFAPTYFLLFVSLFNYLLYLLSVSISSKINVFTYLPLSFFLRSTKPIKLTTIDFY